MKTPETTPAAEDKPTDFIREIVAADLASGRHAAVRTRFPPEPNGHLHIGHAKSICLNFGIAREFGGRCNLRMDDTNPSKEESSYVRAIIADVKWLIGGWADAQLAMANPESTEPFYTSDYFDPLHDFAVQLIEKGRAYVCDLTPADTEEYRGSPDRPGRESPYRDRPIAENLDFFARMKAGEFPDSSRTLRAKIDMTAPNMWLRDPVLYRIRHVEHHQAGSSWCIYPMYDFAHGLSDYIEGITHSVCTLEFEVHRPLYDWILQALELPRKLPHQYEFARLNLSYTVMSKRKLLQLVRDKLVKGWDDPRLPTISGMRRRGVPADALRRFAYTIGITKYNGVTDVAVLEHAIRQQLNRTAVRRLAVLRPIKLILTNLPDDYYEGLEAINNPEDPEAGQRALPFSRTLYIERDDFSETPPPKFFRLKPGGEVRLKYAYIIKCDDVIKDESGRIQEVRCTVDRESRSGLANANRKVKGTIHWVSAPHAIETEVRLYDRLFTSPDPDDEGDFLRHLNPNSLEIVTARAEPSLALLGAAATCQFERLGYFTLDPDSSPDHLVMNRTITLRDNWAKNG